MRSKLCLYRSACSVLVQERDGRGDREGGHRKAGGNYPLGPSLGIGPAAASRGDGAARASLR